MVALLPAAELLSFLKHAQEPWTERDLSKALKLNSGEAKRALEAMQLQGYIEPIGRTQKWRTTDQGRVVSGAKTPRFTREAVEEALSTLSNRIRASNDNPNAEYTVSRAVAFGDFLFDRTRVQAAEVGLRLTPRKDSLGSDLVSGHKAEEAFLKQFRGRSALLHIEAYQDWMGDRSHRELL
jgi:hypothetical protein